MSTLVQLAAELKVWVSQIDPLATLPLVQRAYKDIRHARNWSWLKQNGAWVAPNQVTTGTVTTTQFTTTVTCDATAQPFWQAMALPPPPQYPIVFRQFRISGNPIYNIVGYNGTNQITLDRPMAEQGGAGLSYQIYMPYMPAPATDFKRWLSIVDPISGYRFRYRNMFRTQKELDKRDPQRTSYGWPTWVVGKDYVSLPGDTVPRPRFELGLGHPIQQIGYILEYTVNGDVMTTPTGVLPAQVSDQTIIARACVYAHELLSNQPNVTLREKQLHLQKILQRNAEYLQLLQTDKQLDNAIFDSQVIDEPAGPELSGPLDSNYMQDHVLYYTY